MLRNAWLLRWSRNKPIAGTAEGPWLGDRLNTLMIRDRVVRRDQFGRLFRKSKNEMEGAMQMAHELCELEVRERGRTNPFAEGRGTGAEKLVRVYAGCFRSLPDALDGIALRHDRTITEYATVSSMVEKGPVEDDSIAHEALYPSRVRPCAFLS